MPSTYTVSCPCCTPVTCCQCGQCCFSSNSTISVSWTLPVNWYEPGDCSTVQSLCATTEMSLDGLTKSPCTGDTQGTWAKSVNLGNAYSDCTPLQAEEGTDTYVVLSVVATIVCGSPLDAYLQVSYQRYVTADGISEPTDFLNYFFFINPPSGDCFAEYSVEATCCGASGTGTVQAGFEGGAYDGNGSFTFTIANNTCCTTTGETTTCIKGTPNCDGTCVGSSGSSTGSSTTAGSGGMMLVDPVKEADPRVAALQKRLSRLRTTRPITPARKPCGCKGGK